MLLKERIHADMITAMKNKEKSKLTMIRMIMSDIKDAEIKMGLGKVAGDQEVIAVIQKLKKQMIESYDAYKLQGTNNEKIEETKSWIELLESYLPKQLNEEEIKTIVREIMTENGYVSKKDMSNLMKQVMDKIKGKADGKLINKVVLELLS